MNEEIQLAGANARAAGTPNARNPYFAWDELPAATGETVEQWNAKVAAWDLGWRMEDAMRG